MRLSCIVKGRLAGHFKGERAACNMHCAYQVVLVESGSCVLDRHEIGDLTDSGMVKKARDEDIGGRKIHLLQIYARVLEGSDAEEAALCTIENGSKDAGRVKIRDAAPIDRPILANQCNGIQITNEPVVLDGQVCLRSGGRALGVFIRHCSSPLACRDAYSMRTLEGREPDYVTFSRSPNTMIRDIVEKSNGRTDKSAFVIFAIFAGLQRFGILGALLTLPLLASSRRSYSGERKS